MSASYIPIKIRFQLWAVSGGRCEYEGCNQPLWYDLVTKNHLTTAYIAHIIADKPDGPRGDPVLSKELGARFSNLMLLCDTHHRLIDTADVAGHPVRRLTGMKKRHETRISLQTSLGEDKQSHVLHYGANIDRLNSSISWKTSYEAMAPDWYPAEANAIEIGLNNSPFQDATDEFWKIEKENLRLQFDRKVQTRLGQDINHLSVFALAPQPLLIELGRLVSDILPVAVYQHQREPEDSWKWVEDTPSSNYMVIPPSSESQIVALNLSLSATIVSERITRVLGNDTAIWTITINERNNDFLKSRDQLIAFRKCLRKVLDQIKTRHNLIDYLHLFPAVPVAFAVEIGRVWMPKADLPLRVYDQNNKLGGFRHALDIRN